MDRSDLLFVGGTLVCIFLPIVFAFAASGKYWRAAEEKAHARRIAEARMNARLLRLNI